MSTFKSTSKSQFAWIDIHLKNFDFRINFFIQNKVEIVMFCRYLCRSNQHIMTFESFLKFSLFLIVFMLNKFLNFFEIETQNFDENFLKLIFECVAQQFRVTRKNFFIKFFAKFREKRNFKTSQILNESQMTLSRVFFEWKSNDFISCFRWFFNESSFYFCFEIVSSYDDDFISRFRCHWIASTKFSHLSL